MTRKGMKYEYAAEPKALSVGKRKPSSNSNKSGENGNQGILLRNKTKNDSLWKLRQLDSRSEDNEVGRMLKQSTRIPMDLSAHLIEQSEIVETAAYEIQTDAFTQSTLPSPRYIPRKTGVESSTQIEDQSELFNFDYEVEPLVNLIVQKTLEQSLVELREEAQMQHLLNEKMAHEEARQAISAAEKEVEDAEIENRIRKRIVVGEARRHLRAQKALCAKSAARSLYQDMIGGVIRNNVFRKIAETQPFYDETTEMILTQFMPWLSESMSTRMDARTISRNLVDSILHHAIKTRPQAYVQYRESLKPPVTEQEEADVDSARSDIIKVYMHGLEGMQAEESIGPIELSLKDTVAQAEQKIDHFLQENIDQYNSTQRPEGGYLALVLQLNDNISMNPNDEETTLEFLYSVNNTHVENHA